VEQQSSYHSYSIVVVLPFLLIFVDFVVDVVGMAQVVVVVDGNILLDERVFFFFFFFFLYLFFIYIYI